MDGNRQQAEEGPKQVQVFNIARNGEGGGKRTVSDRASPQEGGGRGAGSEEGHGQENAPKSKKKAKKRTQKPEEPKEEAPPGGRGGADEGLAEEARKVGEAVDAAANQLQVRANEARRKAEEALAEPLRARMLDLDLQARAGGRDLFKDMVSEGVDSEKVTAIWVAKYVARHGFA